MSELSETPVAAAAEAEELDFEEGESAVAGEAGQESSPGKAKATAAPPATEGAEVTEAGTEQEVAAWEADLEEEEGAQEEEEEPIVWEAGEEITPIAELGIPLSDEEGSEAATAEENDAKVAPADGEGIPEAEQDGKEGEDAAATQTVSFVDTREKQSWEEWSKQRYSFKKVDFDVGYDVTTAEAAEAQKKRMERFGGVDRLKLREERQKKFGNAQSIEEAKSIGAIPAHDPSEEATVRSEAVYVYGTDNMDTKTIQGLFEAYHPAFVQWINDSSCNIVWEEEYGAKRALAAITEPIDLSVEVTPLTWRRYVPLDPLATKFPRLMLRQATNEDRKVWGKGLQSKFYSKHGNPAWEAARKKAQKERRNQRRAEKRRKSQEGPLQLFTKRAREAMARGEYEPRAPDEEGQDARDPETAPQEAQAEAVDSHSPAGGEEQNSGASALPTKVKGRGSTRRGLYGDEAEVAVESEAAYGFGVEDTSFGGVRPGLQSRLGAPRTLSARLGERAQ